MSNIEISTSYYHIGNPALRNYLGYVVTRLDSIRGPTTNNTRGETFRIITGTITKTTYLIWGKIIKKCT